MTNFSTAIFLSQASSPLIKMHQNHVCATRCRFKIIIIEGAVSCKVSAMCSLWGRRKQKHNLFFISHNNRLWDERNAWKIRFNILAFNINLAWIKILWGRQKGSNGLFPRICSSTTKELNRCDVARLNFSFTRKMNHRAELWLFLFNYFKFAKSKFMRLTSNFVNASECL